MLDAAHDFHPTHHRTVFGFGQQLHI
jgi:hypothetical protein